MWFSSLYAFDIRRNTQTVHITLKHYKIQLNSQHMKFPMKTMQNDLTSFLSSMSYPFYLFPSHLSFPIFFVLLFFFSSIVLHFSFTHTFPTFSSFLFYFLSLLHSVSSLPYPSLHYPTLPFLSFPSPLSPSSSSTLLPTPLPHFPPLPFPSLQDSPVLALLGG